MKYYNIMKLVLFFCFLVCFESGNVVLAVENEEIEFLLSYIAASDCIFKRNNKQHQAQEAREHLEMKYKHAGKHIKTADDFIEKIASKSSITRRKYAVQCTGVELSAEQWLKQALASHRAFKKNMKKKGDK